SIIVIIVVALVIIQNVNNISQIKQLSKESKITNMDRITEMPLKTEKAPAIGIGAATYNGSGMALMCINTPPTITYDCNLTNATLNIADTFNCTINSTDPNGNQIYYYLTWNTTPSIFTITPSGVMNFTPTRSAMNRTSIFQIHTMDSSICANNDTSKEYEVMLIGDNRPPELIRNIPDQSVIKDRFYRFHATDYFVDPDGDSMSFFYIFTSGNTVSVRAISSSIEVWGLECGISTVYYVAVDFFGLTASSNVVQYNVICPDESTPSRSDSDGSGGGGGGSSSITRECIPQWRCGAWSECLIQNYSYRQCLDFNGCESKYEQFFFENCTYTPNTRECIEEWECSDWSTCNNEIHTRTCLDINTCGTNNTRPVESEKCSRVPSCFNGIQDKGETGIDCGGPCGECRNIEQPKDTKSNIAIIISGILILVLILIVLALYKDKITYALKKMFKPKPRIKRKIYINDKQKNRLVQMLNIAQARVDEHKISHAVDELSIFQKEYFKQLLALDSIDKKELIEKVMKLKDKDLEQLLVMFYAKITNIVHARNKGLDIKAEEVQTLIDEASHEIFLIAEFSDEDAIASAKERTTLSTDPMILSYNMLSTIYIALKFGELIDAKNAYKDVLAEYTKLSDKDKSIIYTDIIRAFHAINYLEKLYKK
ncbi:MAG: hypothetical protein ACP5OA_01250, partial [Candidatus Woesearchaeota archaeon]